MTDAIRFEAPWDSGLWAMTVGAIALVLVVTLSVMAMGARAGNTAVLGVTLLASLPGLACVAGCYWWAPRAFSIDASAVRVERRAGAVVLPLASIHDVRTLDDGRRLHRVFGVGGVFGYYGDFREAELGNLQLYATRGDGRVAIFTGRGVVVVTPARPAQFQLELRRRLHPSG